MLSLYLRRVRRQDLPKREIDAFLKTEREHKALAKHTQKLEEELGTLYTPIRQAHFRGLGLTPEMDLEVLKKAAEAKRTYLTTVAPLVAVTKPGQLGTPVWPPGSGIDCRDIAVRVCKKRVCVDQPFPLAVDSFWRYGGSGDAIFNQIDSNTFSAIDHVWGTSTHEFLHYHRHEVAADGLIVLGASGGLVEQSTVRGVGVVFEATVRPDGLPYQNGAIVSGMEHGDTPSWAQAEMYYQLRVRYKKPGAGLVEWYTTPWTTYLATGEVVGTLGLTNNVVGQPNRRDLYLEMAGQFPAGTLFFVDAYLGYWIRGFGECSYAAVIYNMRAKPYVNLQSCSYQYPEYLTIHVPDYIP